MAPLQKLYGTSVLQGLNSTLEKRLYTGSAITALPTSCPNSLRVRDTTTLSLLRELISMIKPKEKSPASNTEKGADPSSTGNKAQNHSRLENTVNIMKSNHKPNTAKFTTNPCP